MEWTYERNGDCGGYTKWRQVVNGLSLRIESVQETPDCYLTKRAIRVWEIDLTDISLRQLELQNLKFDRAYRGLSFERDVDRRREIPFHFVYGFHELDGNAYVKSESGESITPLLLFSDEATYFQYNQNLIHVVRQLNGLSSDRVVMSSVSNNAPRYGRQQITYAREHHEFVKALLTEKSLVGTYSFFDCSPNSPDEIIPPSISYNSLNAVDKKIRLAILFAYSSELFYRCTPERDKEYAEFLAKRSFLLFTKALEHGDIHSTSVTTQSIISHVCREVGLTDPFPNYKQNATAVKQATSGTTTSVTPTQPSRNVTTPVDKTVVIKPAVSLTNSDKARKALLTSATSPSDLRNKLSRIKENAMADTRRRTSTMSTNKSCSSLSGTIGISGTPLSTERSVNSYNGEIYWSEWVMVPGTDLLVRYSKRKDCYPLEMISNSVPDMAQMAFDYGFFQFRNAGSSTVSFKMTYQSLTEDATVYEGTEPGFLQPGELEAEDLGNWFIGCDLVSITVSDYCRSTK